jgi:WD40 repeat protein
VWDLSKPDPSSGPLILPGHQSFILDLAFSLDGTWFATGSTDRTVQLWNAVDHFTLAAVLRGHEEPVSGLAFSSGGRRLVTASGDRTMCGTQPRQLPTRWRCEPRMVRLHGTLGIYERRACLPHRASWG